MRLHFLADILHMNFQIKGGVDLCRVNVKVQSQKVVFYWSVLVTCLYHIILIKF